MQPITILELTVVLLIILVGFLIMLFWRKTRKIIVFAMSILIQLVIIFYITRPHWIDNQISKRMEYLQIYLDQKHPEVRKEISIQDHRKYRHINPYYLEVIFEDEPLTTYSFFVSKDGEVKLTGFSAPEDVDNDDLDLKYLE